MSQSFLGIEIGGTKLQIVVADERVRINKRVRLAVQRDEGGAGIRRQLEAALRELLMNVKPSAVGVGFGGPVDWRTGQICCSHQIEGWAGFQLSQWLKGIADVPVFIDNDANVATLSEAVHGAGAGFETVFYVTLGSGVGGGLVSGKRIYHGAKPGESEIGHVRLSKDGTTVESRCSGWAVDRRVTQAISTEPKGVLARLAANTKTGQAKFLAAAMEQGDAVAERILDETTEDLAFGLSHVVHLFHPEIIVLGGGLSLVGEPLRSRVEQFLPKFTMEAFAPGPGVALASLGEDVVPIGAVQLAIDRLKTS